MMRHAGKGLVDLPEVDVARLQPSFGEGLVRGHGRGVGEVGDVPGGFAVGEDAGPGRKSLRLRPIPLVTTSAAARHR